MIQTKYNHTYIITTTYIIIKTAILFLKYTVNHYYNSIIKYGVQTTLKLYMYDFFY